MEKELIFKAKQAKTPEELIAIAKENGMEMTEERAKTYFEQLNPTTGELSNDELDNVAGGACYAYDGALLTTIGYRCKYYEEVAQKPFGVKGTCCRCRYWDHDEGSGYETFGAPLKCLNPKNYKKG